MRGQLENNHRSPHRRPAVSPLRWQIEQQLNIELTKEDGDDTVGVAVDEAQLLVDTALRVADWDTARTVRGSSYSPANDTPSDRSSHSRSCYLRCQAGAG
ncbi:hypothetical protein [Streptomyces sp. NPDC097981]|uniref:hypothetical protein n=1 Tax=Streptomyces sp. NPDC097981 TaxID=3155428 RepID=UPI003329DEDB